MQSPAQLSQVVLRNITSFSKVCKHTRRLHYGAVHHRSTLNEHLKRASQGPLVFHSTTQNPFENLALEHFLLTQSRPSSKILIFYTNRPCVVVGRNQNPWSECNLLLLQNGLRGRPIDLVRRRSGGGAVFHDAGNLNFSVIVPNDTDFTRRKHAEMVVKALKNTPSMEELQIFEDIWVNERHDIVMKRQAKVFKVSGSAFKLTRGRALHHGTLLHSSPNLNVISKFLRSSSASYIQAKGVESVRSPVSNLYSLPDSRREELRSAITSSVVNQFSQLYGHASEYSIGEADVAYPEIQDGLKELVSDDWRWNQTPRFEFTSPSIEGQLAYMSINRGMIEESSISETKGKKLSEIKDWCVTKVPALNNLLAQSFPFLATAHTMAKGNDNTIIDQQKQKITRRLKDGSVEVEQKQNLVEIR